MYNPRWKQLSVFEYDVIDYTLELQHKQSIMVELRPFLATNISMCEVENENGDKYQIVLVITDEDDCVNLFWISLNINRNDSDSKNQCVFEIDTNKTKEFERSLDQCSFTLNCTKFDFTMWKHYLILFERWNDHSIVYFDFHKMKWHQSSKV